LRDTLAPEGVVVDAASYYADFLGFDDRGCIGEAFRRSGRTLEPPVLLRLAAAKTKCYADRVRGGLPLVPGVREFVRAASGLAHIAIVSGAVRQEITAGLEQAGIGRVRDVHRERRDVAHGKPDPKAITCPSPSSPAVGRRLSAVGCVEDSRAGARGPARVGRGCVICSPQPTALKKWLVPDLVWDSFDKHNPRELTR